MLPSAPQQIATGGCFQFGQGDSTLITIVWNGGSSYTILFEDNHPGNTCEDQVSVTYSSLKSPTWAYFIAEDPASTSSCSFTSNDYCELPSWSTAYQYTGLLQGGQGGNWMSFDTNSNPTDLTYMNQGCSNNVYPSSVSSGDYFTMPYSTSAQSGYQC